MNDKEPGDTSINADAVEVYNVVRENPCLSRFVLIYASRFSFLFLLISASSQDDDDVDIDELYKDLDNDNMVPF